MPYRKWTVEPVFVCRNPQPPDKSDSEFEHVTNRTLVKCIYQMSSLLQVADRIFEEIGSECRLIFERAQRISSRVENCNEVILNLNARGVQVPVSDLLEEREQFRKRCQYQSTSDSCSQLFLPSSRTPCIDKLYNEAYATPVSLICDIDRFRTDGCTSSQLFMVTPVLGGTRRKKKKMLDIETRKPADFRLDNSAQEIMQTDGSEERTSSESPSLGNSMNDRLPLPEELALATSLEYPSAVVPVDTTGNSFLRMIRSRRSLIHTDFEIKRKKSKHKSKRRHTVCEGNNKDLEDALKKITMINNSCQTDEPQESTSFFSFRRSFSRRRRVTDSSRRETIALDGLNLDLTRKDSDPIVQDTRKDNQATLSSKKSGKGSLISRAARINPISSLSAAISMAVKMRHSKPKPDDGRSSSGNWSASSSTRASIDSDQHHAISLAVERNSNVSRSSVGKDSVLSDATTVTTLAQQETTRNDQSTCSGTEYKVSSKRKGNKLWDYDRSRDSNASTPERTSDCTSTPVIMSPYANRRNHSNYYASSSAFDDGDSSVYSVDTDGYYTSMHTDSGLWNVLNNIKPNENPSDSIRGVRRRESQSSVSTIGNGSINSLLSKIVTETENSSTCSSLKRSKPAPDPPPRISSCNSPPAEPEIATEVVQETREFEKENSLPKNGSASESDYESRDRLRVKTTINSSRYPSLCAVTPETSDDEGVTASGKAKTFVVAEVHREETREDSTTTAKTSETAQNASHLINMYGGHSPTESTFSSSLLQNSSVTTSTPKPKGSVSSFTSESDAPKAQFTESQSLVQKLLSDLRNIPNPIKDLPVSEQAFFPKTKPILEQSSLVKNKLHVEKDKNLIPLKYAQRITVTPIVKHEQRENGNAVPPKSKSFLKNPLNSLPFLSNESSSPKPKSPSYVSFQSPDSPVSSSTSLTPDTATICGAAMGKKAVARVTLDPMGKVIYSSSSLERNKTENVNYESNCKSYTPKYSTLPKVSTTYSSTATSPSFTANNNNFFGYQQTHKDCPQTPPIQKYQQNSSQSQNLLFRPSRGGRFCRTYFPSHIISPSPSSYNTSPSVPKTDSINDDFRNRPLIQRNMKFSPISRAYSPNATTTISPNHRISTNQPYRPQQTCNDNKHDDYGSPVPQTPSPYSFRPVTPQQETENRNCYKTSSMNNNNSPGSSPQKLKVDSSVSPLLSAYPYQSMESSNTKISEFTSLNPPDVIPSSSTPPSTLDVTARTVRKEGGFLTFERKTSNNDPSNLKSLSSSELFAIIHNSKKKHNIKTESEKSLSPLSSRSSSPGICMMTSPAKSPKIETGVLSRLSRDQKTSDSNCVSPTTDRLNRSKPTSIHDFKMLLLQTGVGGSKSPSRPSAAELLKVSPTRQPPASSATPRSLSNSPVPKYHLNTPVYSGPMLVKRNIRTRSPYLSRYDSTYPPIWEDVETADENQNAVRLCSPPKESYKQELLLDNESPNKRATSTWV